jgi:NADPH-dependent 2,4-dienoyl-CoA reductase/sulfur reductase-like enzyme
VRHVVVVGASLAGVHAVDGLREAGFDGEVTLLGAEPQLPYDRPPLSKDGLRLGLAPEQNLLHPADWYDQHGVQLRLGCEAVGLDVERRRLALAGGEEIGYDGLILATGSRARRFDVGAAGAPVYLLRTAADSARLHERLVAGLRLVVIGAGFIGLEVAATAKGMGLEVSVVELAPAPLARVLGDEVGAWFHRYHAAHDVDVHCGNAVTGIEATGGVSKVHLRDGTVLAADVIVAGVGSVPAVEWLRSSGLHLADGVVCDAYLRTSAPDVVAAGDIVRWYNPLFDEDLRIEQWTNAVEQGSYAARSLLGAATEPYSSAPYFWSDQFSAKMRFVGRANAAQHVVVERSDESAVVALYGRDGLVRGALCVNATRRLIALQQAIVDRTPWAEVVPG